jgi:DNA-directed RNA polymerase subunit RPC12/RpoP
MCAARLDEAQVNVFPIQTPLQEGAQAKCPNCGSAVVADQRYCLTCGQPCSPVRLAFLDVLQAENELRSPPTIAQPPVGYLPPLPREEGAIGSLRRYSGVFGLLAVLLMTGLIGLLVGHWLAPSKAPAAQILKIEGAALPVAGAPASGVSTTQAAPSSTKAPAATKNAPATEAQEVKEVKEAESPKAKLKAPVKTSSSSLQKISKLNGKKYQQEVNKLVKGDQPIETGG